MSDEEDMTARADAAHREWLNDKLEEEQERERERADTIKRWWQAHEEACTELAGDLVGLVMSGRVELITWIPVAERLPEYGQWVLAAFVSSGEAQSCPAEYTAGDDDHEFTWDDELLPGVTHWAELPKGPGR